MPKSVSKAAKPDTAKKPAKAKKPVARAAATGARKTAPVESISMRELQKISAQTIEALRHPVPIKSGDRTVAILSPLPKRIPPEGMAEVMEAIRKAAATRSKEADARLAAYLGEPLDDADE
jgi:hypothetical protein